MSSGDNVLYPEFDQGAADREAAPAWMDEALDALYGERDVEPVTAQKSNRGRPRKHPVSKEGVGVTFDDLYAYMPSHNYIFAPAREMWPAASVDARLPPVLLRKKDGSPILKDGKPVMMKASRWLDKNHPVEQAIWAPGFPMIIADRLVDSGGWIHREGCSCFNLYRPPIVESGDPTKAQRWVDHVHHVYPNDADHMIKWFAQRVQHPEVKINHALVMGGKQGIGKDTLLEPVKYAIGPWNMQEVAPATLFGNFNGFLKSVILRVSEARDLGDVDRFAFYDHTKVYAAAPPDVLRVNEKNIREHSVFNVTGMIITTNHKTDGIFLPSDDRRHYVAWSDLTKENFTDEYWLDLWFWYEHDHGLRHVAAYLATLDISDFNPKAPPPKTDAFWAIVDANRATADAEMADLIDQMMRPAVITIAMLMRTTPDDGFREFLCKAENRKKVAFRLEECGYEAVRNKAAADGLWKSGGKRCVVYAQKTMSERDRVDAVEKHIEFERRR